MSAAVGKSQATLSEEALKENQSDRTGEIDGLGTIASTDGELVTSWFKYSRLLF